jgi:hypothetical protein
MIPEDLYKKLIDLYGLEYGEKESEHETEKLNLLREAINNFDTYTKGDAYWILDGIWGEEQDHLTYAEAYHKLYEELNKKRHEKWGEDH